MNHFIYGKYINKHIVSEKETCLVESFNSSMRDKLARLKRKTKAYSKSKYMLEISLNLWMYSKNIFNDTIKYCRYYINEDKIIKI